jgi:hypothetical protein
MTLHIKLFDNWKITSDTNNIMLVRTENNRDFVEGYFLTIEGAIQSLINKQIRGFSSSSIEELLKEIKSLETRLSKAVEPLKLEVRAGKGGSNE